MNDVLLSCDCDCVIEMEDMAVGVREMLQYAHAVLSRREVRELLEGLEYTLRGEDSSPVLVSSACGTMDVKVKKQQIAQDATTAA